MQTTDGWGGSVSVNEDRPVDFEKANKHALKIFLIERAMPVINARNFGLAESYLRTTGAFSLENAILLGLFADEYLND